MSPTTYTKITKATGTSYTKIISVLGSSRYGYAIYGASRYGGNTSYTKLTKASGTTYIKIPKAT